MLKLLVILLTCWITQAFAQQGTMLTRERLTGFNGDWGRLHDAEPLGVPREYSWALKSKLGAGNLPGKYDTAVAWGHVFWSKGTVGHPGVLQFKNFHAYICSGAERKWQLMQAGKTEGAQFRADFKGNAAKRPQRFDESLGVVSVLFEAGHVFHFWPASRTRLPKEEICGFVVLIQARVDATESHRQDRAGGYLLGLGADYWLGTSSGWDNFKTNTGIAMGHLKYVGPEWTWYGLSTATDADLLNLYDSGLLPTARD